MLNITCSLKTMKILERNIYLNRKHAPENPAGRMPSEAERPLCGIAGDSVTAVQALLFTLSACSNVSLDTTGFARVLISVLESKSEVGLSVFQNYNNISLDRSCCPVCLEMDMISFQERSICRNKGLAQKPLGRNWFVSLSISVQHISVILMVQLSKTVYRF